MKTIASSLLFLLPSLLAAQTVTNELPLMPWPATISVDVGRTPVSAQFSASVTGAGATDARVQFAVSSLYSRLARQTGLPILPPAADPTNPTMLITVGAAEHAAPQRVGDDEKYSLTIAGGHVALTAGAPLGVLRGIETFLQLIEQNEATGSQADAGFSVHNVTIHDEPRFPWRGLSLDVSRHFIPVDGIKRTLDGMAAVKLNVLHWHLSDDQGFRVESKERPKLQQMGSDGLFYTQDEIRQIVSYAALRGIRVVPEFDMPGHSTSWLVGYPELGSSSGPYQLVREHGILTSVLDPTKEFTYQFLDGFIGEMTQLFPDDYFHIGGDEVAAKQWNQSTGIQKFMAEHKLQNAAALQAYFNQRMLKIVTSHGKQMMGWDEILHPELPKTILIQSWRGQDSLWQAARQGYRGILSAGYYLDLMYPAAQHYAVDPMKVPPGHKSKSPADLPPGAEVNLTSDQAKLILGGEAAMWEELATAENLDAKLWPRLAAIAERFWSSSKTTDAASMYQRLAVINRWLQWLGLTQFSNLELMRQRLAGDAPLEALDKFAAVLEPVKGYARHRQQFTSLSPFNHLVDSIPPESEPARRFSVAVDAFLKEQRSARDSQELRHSLTEWMNATQQVRPTLQANSLLTENIAVADGVADLCKAGIEAISFLADDKSPPTGWKTAQAALTGRYNNKSVGDFIIPFAPAVAKLVSAVQ